MTKKIDQLTPYLENPNVRAMLDLLANTEGTDKSHGYNTLVGGKKISDLSKHPNIVGLKTKDGASTASGRYQITGTTFRGLAKQYGFSDFSPQTQDLAAIALIKEKGALNDILTGKFTSAVDKVKDTWVSLPNSTTKNQREVSTNYVQDFLANKGIEDNSAPVITNTFSESAQREGARDYAKFKAGKMSDYEKNVYLDDAQNGYVYVPPNAKLPTPQAGAFGFADEQNIYMPEKAPPPQKETGIVESIGNFFGGITEQVTGNERQTKETQALPDWAAMPELNDLTSLAGWRTGAGTLFSNPEETVKVIKSNYPNVAVQQDSKGNYLLKSSQDGKWYAIKPGFQVSDIPRAAANILAFTPAGRANTVLGAGAATAATQAAVEASQAATGGEFSPSDVLLAGAAGGAGQGVANVLGRAKTGTPKLLQKTEPSTTSMAANAAETVGIQKPLPQTVEPVIKTTAPQAPPPQNTQLTGVELGDVAREASTSVFGRKGAQKILAEQAAPDAEILAAADRLGVSQYLQPDHVTTNQVYRELAQAVKSIPASDARALELKGLEQIAKKADDIVLNLGGSDDLSTLKPNVFDAMRATQKQLNDKSDVIYKELSDLIPSKTLVDVNTTKTFLKQEAEELGADRQLSQLYKDVLERLTPREGEANLPTYRLVDEIRQDLVAARIKREGPFKEAPLRKIIRLEDTLEEDQSIAAATVGMREKFDLARKTVAIRKALENDMAFLFGDALDKSFVSQLSSATKALPAGDAEKFTKLLKAIPEAQKQEVVAGALQTAFGKSAKRGDLDFTNYSKWYDGVMRNKESAKAIMGNLPSETRQALNDLYKVSKGISLATKERITTGRIQAVKDQLKDPDNLMLKIYDGIKRATVGYVTNAIVPTGSGIAASVASILARDKTATLKAADALLASEEFKDLVVSVAKGAVSNQKIKKLSNTKKFITYLKAIGEPLDPKSRYRYLAALIAALSTKTNENESN